MGAGPASGQRESGGGVAALGCGAGPGLSESEGNRPAPPPARPRNPLVIPRDNSQVTLQQARTPPQLAPMVKVPIYLNFPRA